MAEEYFWGMTLSSEQPTGSWDPENDNTDPSRPIAYQGDQTLVIKQAVLGADAKSAELNVIQVEAMGFNGSLKIPVVRLQLPETPQCQLDLSFPDPPVAFTLVKGNGPISLVGNIGIAGHVAGEEDDIDDELDEEEDENLEEEDEDAVQNAKGEKKRKMSLNSTGKFKKAKIDDANDIEIDEDDMDDEDDDPKKKKGAGAKKEKPKKKK